MKILSVHKFHYIEGGAERYVFNLSDVLEKRKHTVIPFSMRHPKNVPSPYDDFFSPYFNPEQFKSTKNPMRIAQNAIRVIYNREAQKKLASLIEKTKPEIAHVHSIYHHLSPAVLKTLKDHHLPVLQTLHDFKLLCPNIVFLDGKNKVCTLCSRGNNWHAMWKKCFRNSLPGSFLVSLEATVHKYLRSYKKYIDVFHVPSRFLGSRIIQNGYSHRPVEVLPYTLNVNNYLPNYNPDNYFVFVGRLSVEKGVLFLLDAIKKIKSIQLKIIGTGPLEQQMKERISREQLTHVKMVGYQSGEALKKLVSGALFTTAPSLCHDNSPLSIYESFSLGNAVLGSRMGGIPELIEPGVDGLVFEPDNTDDFADKVEQLVSNRDKTVQMGKNGRRKAEKLYAPDVHYERIMEMYRKTCKLAG
ncbi:glycosyltransferase family 4 protein [candidate division KSB1 bacterium]|nr:glycosyltransferase family 4 protein [candidate division KSB1 bacterium]